MDVSVPDARMLFGLAIDQHHHARVHTQVGRRACLAYNARTALPRYQKDIGAATKGGYTNNDGPRDEMGVSGDIAWQWNTFTVADKSGKTVDTGKYVTVFGRKNGKWMIIRDIWNSDGPPTA